MVYKLWEEKSGPVVLPGFKCERAEVNSVRNSQRYHRSGVMALQRSDTSWETSQDDLQSIASYLPFFTSWDAIASAETGQWEGEFCDLLVRLFNILHAFRLECEKSMLWIASDHQSLRFLSSLANKAVAAKVKLSPWGDARKVLLSNSFGIPTRNIVAPVLFVSDLEWIPFKRRRRRCFDNRVG